MTDIIKALECCVHRGKGCDECPALYKNAEFCFEDVMIDALDLINSQKAEIEELRGNKKVECDYCGNAEKLKEMTAHGFKFCPECGKKLGRVEK